MPRRRHRRKPNWPRRIALAIAAIPALYLLAALVGSLVPVNRGWTEAQQGTTIYLVSNGIHADLVLPAEAQGLDWRPLLPLSDFAAPDASARWIAFGAGERRVYLDTPRWRDIKPRTIWAALSGGERVMHVEWVTHPGYEARAIRLRPEEYRRLWAAIRADFRLDAQGKPQRIDHPGYSIRTPSTSASARPARSRPATAGSASGYGSLACETSAWSPFAQGLLWRYRAVDQST